MRYERSEIKLLLMRYKKPLLLSSLAIVITCFVGLGAFGLIVYQSGIFVKDKVSSLPAGVVESNTLDAVAKGGVVESLLMNVASSWVQQNLAAAETARFKSGLYCFDALGGPSPESIIAHIKTKVGDARMLTMLDELGANLHKSEPKAQGTASCANWIFSG
jgi:hypothetical protein